MDFRDLRYFVHIAELGSITRAANSLRVAQPSLTRHIHKLEQDLGVAVFARVNRGVRLTEAGRTLLDSATRILRDVDRAKQAVSAQGSLPSGKVVLGMPPTLCPVLLPQLIARMRSDYPSVELEIMQAGSMILPEWLRAGRLDMALKADISRSRLLVTTPLAREEMVLVTPLGARKDRAVSAAEIASTPLIVTEAIRTMTNALIASTGIALKVEMILNSLETIRLMVQDGVCSTILPYSIARRDHAMRLFDVHRLLDGSVQRPLVLATPTGRDISSAIEATSKLIRDIAAEFERAGGFTLQRPPAVRKRGNAPQRPRRQ